MRGLTAVSVVLALAGCPDPEKQDFDGDGFIGLDDCNDANVRIAPDAAEVCDGIDNDCDGLVDDEDDSVDLSTERPWFADLDGDGFGNPDQATVACGPPPDHVADDSDCDDDSADVHPDATEICNGGIDDDCNGFADDGDPGVDPATGSVYYADVDGDAFGDPGSEITACVQPAGAVEDATDCDDLVAAVHPEAVEVCNGIDDDCDDAVDDDDDSVDPKSQTTFFFDQDRDGYGEEDRTLLACEAIDRYVTEVGDCAPALPAIHPGATEICNNGIDDDCDTWADDEDPSLDASTTSVWHPDGDGDGYGVEGLTARACAQPPGFAPTTGDCDDTIRWVNPGAPERCNTVDDDCDASTGPEGVWQYDVVADTWTDRTADFESGTAAAPYTLTTTAAAELDVCAGTYFVNIDAGDDLDIVGRTAGAVLSGGYLTSFALDAVVDTAVDSDLSLTNLTIEDAYFGVRALRTNVIADDVTFRSTGSIIVRDGSALRQSIGLLDLSDVRFVDNDGYAIVWADDDSQVTMSEVSFEDNVAYLVTLFDEATVTGTDIVSRSNDAGFAGLYHERTTVSYDGLTVELNEADYGAGLYFTESSGAVKNATLAENTALVRGGSVRSFYSNVDYDAVTIRDSAAPSGAGAFVTGQDFATSTPSTFANSTFSGNAATSSGGGLYLEVSSTTLDGVTFTGNDAALGGGVYMDRGSPEFTKCTFELNDATADGGGLYQTGGTVALTDPTFDRNTAVDYGGGSSHVNGDVVVLRGLYDANEASFSGGGISALGGSLDLDETTLTSNVADTGPGGAMETFDVASVTLDDVTVSDNTAVAAGGLFLDQSGVVVRNSTISGNQTSAQASGGGLIVADPVGTFELTDSEVVFNSSLLDGGGVFLSGGDHRFTNTLVANNTAPQGAGAYVSSSTSLTCVGSPSGTYGFTTNTNTSAVVVGAGLYMFSQRLLYPDSVDERLSTFVAEDCDFGTPAGGDDNSPLDLSHVTFVQDCTTSPCVVTSDEEELTVDDDATFCVGAACPIP